MIGMFSILDQDCTQCTSRSRLFLVSFSSFINREKDWRETYRCTGRNYGRYFESLSLAYGSL